MILLIILAGSFLASLLVLYFFRRNTRLKEDWIREIVGRK